jgi:hypothetical protein
MPIAGCIQISAWRGTAWPSDKIGLNPAKKSAEAMRGHLWGHLQRLAAQPVDSQGDVIVAASTS